ncbi:PREDICTED: uncharacterized protein LOC108684328 isoform X2 [Atta colombica]|uniref:uncharacterized protein LOC108684328 isoform X2 n=1 Tax=Atta colombica TaxID=520822 RepID=UPI00084C7C7D|nr:PREDICTED: uncharacterized protein LOC108684328 isoform X2 [Atta colombica]
MKMRRNFYNNGLTCAVVWLSLACLLFILSLATMIIAKPIIDEIDTSMTSKNATNETCPPIMCPIMICRWGFNHEKMYTLHTSRIICDPEVNFEVKGIETDAQNLFFRCQIFFRNRKKNRKKKRRTGI